MVVRQSMTAREIESVLQEVTEEEVAFYQEYRWVMLKQLVHRDFATELLRVGQDWRKSLGKDLELGRPAAGLAQQKNACCLPLIALLSMYPTFANLSFFLSFLSWFW